MNQGAVLTIARSVCAKAVCWQPEREDMGLSNKTGFRRTLVSVAIALCLCACAGRPEGVLIPVEATAPGTSVVDMIVATTRARSSGPDLFSGERGATSSYSQISVSIPPDTARKVGEVQWPQRVPGNPATDFVTLRTDEMTAEQARSWFDQRVVKVPKHRVLVFIHGFNNRFDDAVFRFAQIAHDSGGDFVPVLFTWPSRGNVLAYGYDRESASYSRDGLERLLTFLAKSPKVGEISILAHSMGNWVAMETLRQMAIRNGHVFPKIKNVMLAAPDVDVDIFRTQLEDLGSPHPNLTVFVSQDDHALQVSRRVWGSAARLGQVDPEAEPYRSEFQANKITVFDLTKLRTGGALNHGKFAESPEVVQMIGSRLAQGQVMTDDRAGVGDRIIEVTAGAASSIGTAAGVVISAPVAVFDPVTRNNLGAQVDHLGRSVTGTAESTSGLITEPLQGR